MRRQQLRVQRRSSMMSSARWLPKQSNNHDLKLLPRGDCCERHCRVHCCQSGSAGSAGKSIVRARARLWLSSVSSRGGRRGVARSRSRHSNTLPVVFSVETAISGHVCRMGNDLCNSRPQSIDVVGVEDHADVELVVVGSHVRCPAGIQKSRSSQRTSVKRNKFVGSRQKQVLAHVSRQVSVLIR